jgi:hypothetical protein
MEAESLRDGFQGTTYEGQPSWFRSRRERNKFIQDLVTEGTLLHGAVMKGRWRTFAPEEVITLALLTMNRPAVAIRSILKAAQRLLRFGKTPRSVEVKMLKEVHAYLSAYRAGRQ